MSRETKVGLLVGLLFIVVFGLVLSQTAGIPEEAPAVADASKVKKADDFGKKIAAPVNIGEPAGPAKFIGLPIGGEPKDKEAKKDAESGPSLSDGSRVEPKMKTYTIQPGDRIAKIMRDMYGANYVGMGEQVLKANHVTAVTLRAGSELRMPALDVRKDSGNGATSGDWGATAGPKSGTGAGHAKSGSTASDKPKAGPTGPIAHTPAHKEIKSTTTKAPATTGFSGKTYVVKRGDTLYDIAKAQLGDIRGVDQIVAMNRDKISDPKMIRVGQVLKMPAKLEPVVRASATRTASSAPKNASKTPTKTTTVATAMREFKLD